MIQSLIHVRFSSKNIWTRLASGSIRLISMYLVSLLLAQKVINDTGTKLVEVRQKHLENGVSASNDV